MGKKNRKNTTKSSTVNTKKNISILTPTVKSRDSCLVLLADCILNQTFLSRIKEWVIVSADRKWNEDEFEYFISKLSDILPTIEVKGFYVTYENIATNGWDDTDNLEAIGYLRNVTNWVSTGDFLVCMDDDDYYPPRRVEHAVTMLTNSSKMVAGCSGHYMYDSDIKWMFQFRKLSNNHSVNNAFAYKREYLNSGAKYDSTRLHAEEKSFLNSYKTEMIQLNPKYTVVQMIHYNNTYNKRQILVGASWAPKERCNIHILSKSPKGYIPPTMLDKYHTSLGYESGAQSEYDIVYYLGWGSITWSPYETKLGGSEQAVKHLVDSWVSTGKKVAVYGDFSDDVIEKTKNDESHGDYLSFKNFKVSLKYKTIILWRNYGQKPLLEWPIKADKIYVDIHDSVPLPESTLDNLEKITNIIIRSQYHGSMMEARHRKSPIAEKFRIIPNGVRVDDFTPDSTVERDPKRFVWCSCYTRGLGPILQIMWPIIKHNEPDATFHIYYGMDNVRDENFKNNMNQLLQYPGVIDHGRQPVEVIVKEKQTASFHLYYSATDAETDCISIRESCVAGCIPILSKHGVFAERNGIHLDGNPKIKEDLIKAASSIVNMLKDGGNTIEESRQKLIQGKDHTWLDIAASWQV